MSKTVRVAALIYASSILLSRVVGLVRESVVGRALGASGETDVYLASFVLPDFLNYLLAGGLLSLVFIPIFQAHLARGDDAEGWRAFSTIANTVLGLMLVATGVLFIFAPELVELMVSDAMGPGQQAKLVRLTRIILPAQIFHMVGALVSATLQARDKHAMPALAPVIYTSCIVIGGLAFSDSLGAEGFSWGVLAGSFLGPFLLPLIAARRHGLRWELKVRLAHPDLRTYFVRSLPVMLGASVVVLDDMIVKHFASAWTGAIAELGFARTLMRVPMGIFGLAAGMAAFPTLSRLVAQGKRAEAWRTLVGALRMMLLLAFGAQVALTVAGAEIAAVIWGTARFSPEVLARIGLFTGAYCLGLWAWSGQVLVARGFYAQGKTWLPTWIGTAVAVVSLPIYWTLADAHAQLGLAIASSAAISLYMIALTLMLRRSLGGDAEGPGLLDGALRIVPASAAAIAAGWGLSQVLPPWPALLRGALTGGLATALFFGLVVLLRVPEATRLVQMVSRRVRR